MTVHAGQGSGLTNRTFADTGGDEDLQSHNHSTSVNKTTGSFGYGNFGLANYETHGGYSSFNSSSSGSGSGENMPPFVVMRKIMRVK